MTYRFKLFTFNAFCLFSLFLVGCKEKTIDPFTHYDLVKINNSEIHTDIDFPQSIEIDFAKDSLLRAGKYNNYSFYIEYYKLDSKTPLEDKVLKQGSWSKRRSYRKKVEDRTLNGSNLKETSIYFQKDDFLMYGVFIGPNEVQFEKYIIGFSNN
jgi:hypothetical protein